MVPEPGDAVEGQQEDGLSLDEARAIDLTCGEKIRDSTSDDSSGHHPNSSQLPSAHAPGPHLPPDSLIGMGLEDVSDDIPRQRSTDWLSARFSIAGSSACAVDELVGHLGTR